jgi:hypothetical protein
LRIRSTDHVADGLIDAAIVAFALLLAFNLWAIIQLFLP